MFPSSHSRSVSPPGAWTNASDRALKTGFEPSMAAGCSARAAELARKTQRADALADRAAALEAQLTALQALVRQLQSAR